MNIQYTKCKFIFSLFILISFNVFSQVNIEKLRKKADRIVVVTPIANPNAKESHVEGWVNSGYTKLHIWNLVDYDKVVYIDADTLVLQNVDELFDRPTPAGACVASLYSLCCISLFVTSSYTHTHTHAQRHLTRFPLINLMLVSW